MNLDLATDGEYKLDMVCQTRKFGLLKTLLNNELQYLLP
jgi:hypothetical protein